LERIIKLTNNVVFKTQDNLQQRLDQKIITKSLVHIFLQF